MIDCAGECAGTEEEFKKFMEVMEDKDFDKKFPELAKVKKSQEKRESKVAEIPLDGGESVAPMEEKEDVRTKFMKGLLKCTNFSQETMALLSLMNPNNEGGERRGSNRSFYLLSLQVLATKILRIQTARFLLILPHCLKSARLNMTTATSTIMKTMTWRKSRMRRQVSLGGRSRMKER